MSVFHLERWLIRVSGPDRVSFLQNLLTQTVEDFEGVRYGALLNAQGKVSADMLIWTHDDAFILETDLRFGEDLQRRLGLYKLRAEVSVEEAKNLGVVFSAMPFDGALADPRIPDGALGYRKLLPRPEALKLHEPDVAYSRLALECGVPDLADNTKPEELFAGEALLEELDGVDFQKGCFVGQENVSRMKRRATTRRKLCRIAFDGERIEGNAPILAGEAEIGSVRATAFAGAFALVRLDRAMEASENGVPLTAGGREIRLDPPPWLIWPSREEA
ncbi:MAG: hypothetical protein WAU68_09925 [Vitreimonas sp.]